MRKTTITEERRVVTIGRPSIEHLSEDERKAFLTTLLNLILEQYLKDQNAGK